MANYNVQITRGVRFSVNRKANDAVIKRTLRLLAKKRRDDWIENFGSSGSSGGGGGTGNTKRRVRFRFP
jgi:hypothetical protein